MSASPSAIRPSVPNFIPEEFELTGSPPKMDVIIQQFQLQAAAAAVPSKGKKRQVRDETAQELPQEEADKKKTNKSTAPPPSILLFMLQTAAQNTSRSASAATPDESRSMEFSTGPDSSPISMSGLSLSYTPQNPSPLTDSLDELMPLEPRSEECISPESSEVKP